MIIKIGENFNITDSDIKDSDSIMCDPDISNRFSKFAQELKVLAPKANDFLYFSSIMLHSAEAAIINEDGSIKKDASGNPLKCGWDKSANTWKWQCSDPSVRPYKNNNGDIFPEEELLKAYKKWIGKPLCVDHKSSEVDAIRGVIVDAYYDHKNKRVIGLCALDKVNFPELARKVATGYATCVSMGTAVGKAICTDCATVARVESEFCVHMRNKNCYGEINVDLQPIELSIVVNGADPRAKIKQIIASANYLQQRIESEQNVFNKLANTNLNPDELRKMEADLKTLKDSLKTFEDDFSKMSAEMAAQTKDVNNASSGMTESTANDPSDDIQHSNLNTSLSGPPARFADGLLFDLKKMASSFEGKLNNLQQLLNNIKEENMSDISKKGYFQGAGGVNEPTPGKQKYPVDPTNEKLRTQDKQMVGQMDTGPVDGMHPGVDSSPMSEMELKKKLLRAQTEDRAMRRAGFVSKAKESLGYFQGGGEGNEPTPGKAKYPVDPGAKVREKEDKQQTGKKPFPEVGKVDGLYGDDIAKKEKLSRASLKAKFVKAAKIDGSLDVSKSAWQIFLGDKLVLNASVNAITRGNSDALYSGVATKEFGTSLLSNVQKLGVAKVASLYNIAQSEQMAGPMGPPAAPAPAPAPAAGTDPMAGMDMGALDATQPADEAKEPGSPQEGIDSALNEIKNQVADAEKELEALDEEKNTEIPQEATGNVEAAMPAPGAPVTTASLNNVRRELNAALRDNIKVSLNELKAHAKELNTIKQIFANSNELSKEDKVYVTAIAEEALLDSKHALADSKMLNSAFVKYARGTEKLVKSAADPRAFTNAYTGEEEREEREEGLDRVDPREEDVDLEDFDSSSGDEKDETLQSILERLDEGEGGSEDLDGEDVDLDDVGEKDHSDEMKDYETSGHKKHNEFEPEEEGTDMLDSNDPNAPMTEVTLENGEKKFVPAKSVAKSASASLNLTNKEDRIKYRAKLAAEALKFSDMLGKAHPQGGFQTKLDVKPTGDLGKVEGLEEVHSKMMDVANAPPKVRKDAQEIHQLVVQGKIAKEDVGSLVAHGVDPAAVAYYKEMFADADGGKEFAAALVKEHAKAEQETANKVYRAKLARAYDLAYEMAQRGLVSEANISEEVERIMTWNDEGFESMKKVVAKHEVKGLNKKASLPQVGMIEANMVSSDSSSDDLYSALSQAFSANKRSF